jgi:hypothetical protein
VILNHQIAPTTEWILAADDFVETQNIGEARYGMYFMTGSSALEMTTLMCETIQNLGESSGSSYAESSTPSSHPLSRDVPQDFVPPRAPEPPEGEKKRISLARFNDVNSAIMMATSGDQSDNNSNYNRVVRNRVNELAGGMGQIEEEEKEEGGRGHHPRPSVIIREDNEFKNSPDENPSGTQSWQHTMHVSFNNHWSRFEGLPPDWEYMNKQFGIPFKDVPKVQLEGYESRIPAVLEMMKRELLENGGRDCEGIFRLAPDKDDCAFVKKQINSGEFQGGCDVNVLANLIKVWFRDMPDSLFNSISESTIYQVAEMPVDSLGPIEERFPEPTRSMIEWLMDLMAEIVMNEAVNRMSAKNMAIVMSPNLFSISSDNPMVALTMSQKVADFTTKLLAWRLRTKYHYDAGVV